MNKPIEDFQKEYPSKAEKEKALTEMSNAEIDRLIEASTNTQGEIFYSKFKTPDTPAK